MAGVDGYLGSRMDVEWLRVEGRQGSRGQTHREPAWCSRKLLGPAEKLEALNSKYEVREGKWGAAVAGLGSCRWRVAGCMRGGGSSKRERNGG